MPRLLKEPWISAYLRYVKDSESPDAYNLWCAISGICASLKRNVYVNRGFYKLFTNQYIVLVGPPGVGKGQAINPAVEIVKEANTAHFLSDRITAERIIDRLASGFGVPTATAGGGVAMVKDSCATIVSTELPVFLGSSEWMLPYLCEMWDKNEFEYDTKTKGSFVIKDLCVGLVAGCVPDYIRKLNKDATSAITGGFTSRCIFIYATDKSKTVAWPSTAGLTQLRQDLVDDLKSIAQQKGEFQFDPNARVRWEGFYRGLKPDQFESEIIANFKSRMPAHVLKVAMALALSEGDRLVISDTHLSNAIALVNDVKDKLELTFRAVGESPLAAAQDRIMRFIEAKGLVSRSEILKFNYRHITDEDLTRVLMVLVSAGFCEETSQGGKVGYRHLGKPQAAQVKQPINIKKGTP